MNADQLLVMFIYIFLRFSPISSPNPIIYDISSLYSPEFSNTL